MPGGECADHRLAESAAGLGGAEAPLRHLVGGGDGQAVDRGDDPLDGQIGVDLTAALRGLDEVADRLIGVGRALGDHVLAEVADVVQEPEALGDRDDRRPEGEQRLRRRQPLLDDRRRDRLGLLDDPFEQRSDQVVAGREMAVDGGAPEPRTLRDRRHTGVGIARHDLQRGLDHGLAIAACVFSLVDLWRHRRFRLTGSVLFHFWRSVLIPRGTERHFSSAPPPDRHSP